VAGGSHKAYSIQHVLRNSRKKTWITHLVTDQKTAQWILQKEKESANRGA
jgi:DNA-binding transcriptional regulator LsrR (DeoR family)